MSKNNINVCIIDYGSGNVGSVYNIFSSINNSVKVSNEKEDIEKATHIVLPGVGAFGAAMEKITKLASFESLKESVLLKKKLFLGICVGMQILADEGYEHGNYKGLGWIPGSVKKIEAKDFRLPHVGWNNIKIINNNNLLRDFGNEVDFYYVHSYYFGVKDACNVLATSDYGIEFPTIVNRDNIYGVQFHPEKSQKAGIKLLTNFLNLYEKE
jgi:glutamine amidotransferase